MNIHTEQHWALSQKFHQLQLQLNIHSYSLMSLDKEGEALQEVRSPAFCLSSIKIALFTSSYRLIPSLKFLCKMSLKKKKWKGLVDILTVVITASDFQKFDTAWATPHHGQHLMEGSLRSSFSVHGLSPEFPASFIWYQAFIQFSYFSYHPALSQFSCEGLSSAFLPNTLPIHTHTHRGFSGSILCVCP